MSGITGQLLVTIAGNIISGLIMLAGGVFVLSQDWRGKLNRLFFFLTMATLAYTIFFIVASMQTEYSHAYFWWLLNVVDVFITISATHFTFAVIKKDFEWRWFIRATYAIGLTIFITALASPSWFLPEVAPKLYFNYYLSGGPLYAVMLAYFLIFPFVAFVNLVIEYFKSSGLTKQRFEYYILMLIVGYTIGSLNFLLVFDIPVDPVFGMFLGFYFIPIAYGISATNLLDIRLLVRHALYYGVLIATIAAFLSLLILMNDALVANVPYLRFWTIPLGVSVVSVLVGRVVWHQVKELDQLKYEFITIAAHKLRTPLTRIKWEIPQLMEKAESVPEVREGLMRIDTANNRLIELTNVLMESAHTEDVSYQYTLTAIDLETSLKAALDRFESLIREKSITIHVHAESNLPHPKGDAGRITSVIDVMVENAVIYTQPKGTVTITIGRVGDRVKFAVQDSGIGISIEDQSRIFSGFYRSEPAKRSDTEGVGIGLTVAKSIIEKHNGTLGVDSEGVGKGSTFWFIIPISN